MAALSLGQAFGVANAIIPKGGPKTVPALLDFSNTGEIEISGEMIVSQNHIEFLQGCYIDNSDNAVPVTFLIGVTGQRIVARPHSQGYYAFLIPNPPTIIATMAQEADRKVRLHFYNVPIQSQTWETT